MERKIDTFSPTWVLVKEKANDIVQASVKRAMMRQTPIDQTEFERGRHAAALEILKLGDQSST